MTDLFEGFKFYTSLIEDEFVEGRLFDNEYTLDIEEYEKYFGGLGELLDYFNLPKFLKYSKDTKYIQITHEFKKLIFSHTDNNNFVFLEYVFTEGLEYIRSELF